LDYCGNLVDIVAFGILLSRGRRPNSHRFSDRRDCGHHPARFWSRRLVHRLITDRQIPCIGADGRSGAYF
jgi:hypothetical protein